MATARGRKGKSCTFATPPNETSTGGRSGSRLGSQLGVSRIAQCTPYQKTPTSRRIQRDVRRSPVSVEDPMQILVNKTLKLHEVSPLYRFSHDTQTLKSYSKSLSLHLKTEIHRGIALDTEETVDTAVFTVLKGLKMVETDSEAVLISLKQTKVTKKGVEASVTVLSAVLCGVGLDVGVDVGVTLSRPPSAAQFTLLPVLLVKGPVKLTGLLLDWMRSQFDCQVDPRTLSAVDLSWMLAVSAGCVRASCPRPVELVYAVPDRLTRDLSVIRMNVRAADCKRLWDAVHSEENDHINQTEVATFIENLEAHFFHHFGIYLSAITLKRIGTSTVYAAADGRIKLLSAQHVPQILSHMTEIVMEQSLRYLSAT